MYALKKYSHFDFLRSKHVKYRDFYLLVGYTQTSYHIDNMNLTH